jgi:16S rRNA (adenine1518-N6/adenine1519-N6)-dimethyltransferase
MVRPKKHYGQHFLTDKNIARKIAQSLSPKSYDTLVEVGPGTGFLTDFLLELPVHLILIEKDKEAYEFLRRKYESAKIKIVNADFLKTDLQEITENRPFGIIGNFPYNISTQIVFKILENRDLIPETVGMFQWEVAERIASQPGNKTYGILSVLTQLFYQVEILFPVPPSVFFPPPKVKSAVIRMTRKTDLPDVDFEMLKKLVKTAFNQRRKTLRNSLKSINLLHEKPWIQFASLRAEQLKPEDYIELFKLIQKDAG